MTPLFDILICISFYSNGGDEFWKNTKKLVHKEQSCEFHFIKDENISIFYRLVARKMHF